MTNLQPWDLVWVAALSGCSEELLFRGALIPSLYPDWCACFPCRERCCACWVCQAAYIRCLKATCLQKLFARLHAYSKRLKIADCALQARGGHCWHRFRPASQQRRPQLGLCKLGIRRGHPVRRSFPGHRGRPGAHVRSLSGQLCLGVAVVASAAGKEVTCGLWFGKGQLEK